MRSNEVLIQLCFTLFSDAKEMASSSSDMGDNLDALTCSVCLAVYEEPVGLPCGHSFCRVCIETYWERKEEDTACVCPNCREVFAHKPKLTKNVTIAYLMENIVNVKKGGTGGTESRCEVCNGEAARRCVPCEILCCVKHLKPHQQKGHKLVDPGVKIEELRCTKHGKPILLYCKDDESLMCVTCMGGEHEDHKVVSVEIAHSELKGVLAAKYPHVSQSMESVASQLQQVQEEKEQTECSKDLLKRTPLPVLDFSKEEKNLDGLITLNKNFLEKIQINSTEGPVEHPEKVDLDQNNLRRLYVRSPSLDPNSAHRRIKISRDLRMATRTRTENQYPEHPDRFDVHEQVVSCDCFSSGRHYWEVDVGSSLWWGIGICLNSMSRKGLACGLGGNPESWCLCKCNNKFFTLHNNRCTSLSIPGFLNGLGSSWIARRES
uniref:E3 ubiquitin/ISG15 ligase TRIM25-like n=1 Tax=Myxine glutinosa TaxID=7769 RepID=UPI00358F1357